MGLPLKELREESFLGFQGQPIKKLPFIDI